jgi:hypothetical protein
LNGFSIWRIQHSDEDYAGRLRRKLASVRLPDQTFNGWLPKGYGVHRTGTVHVAKSSPSHTITPHISSKLRYQQRGTRNATTTTNHDDVVQRSTTKVKPTRAKYHNYGPCWRPCYIAIRRRLWPIFFPERDVSTFCGMLRSKH